MFGVDIEKKMVRLVFVEFPITISVALENSKNCQMSGAENILENGTFSIWWVNLKIIRMTMIEHRSNDGIHRELTFGLHGRTC